MPLNDLRANAIRAFDQHAVLLQDVPSLAIKAGVTAWWHKHVGRGGIVVCIDTFGESAPAGDPFRHFGITAARVVESTSKLISP